MILVYKFLNIFFFLFHTILIFFNLFGWISKKTRIINLITQLLTFFSWFILGIFYGIGYCFCTDWHWSIRRKLGIYDEFNSYIQFLIHKMTGLIIDDNLTLVIAMIFFFSSLFVSVLLNVKDFIIRLRKK